MLISQNLKYSFRDSSGKFAKYNRLVRLIGKNKNTIYSFCKCGKNACNNVLKIVSGRLYNWRGTIVRAFGKVGDKRLIMVHKSLSGLVNDNELTLASKEAVSLYLKESSKNT